MRSSVICAIALLAVLLSACSETDVAGDKREPYQYLLKDGFGGTTFPATAWTSIGPGTVTQDAAFGDPAPAMRLDSSGVQSGLTAGPFDAMAKYSVRIAIDPAPGSGASASYVLHAAATIIASVKVEEGQITYTMGSGTPVTVAWTTDGDFHLFEFEGSYSTVSGGHWWKRDGQIVASSTQPMAATQMMVSLEGPSLGGAWFDDARVYHMLMYPH